MHETILIDQKIRHPGNFHPLLDIVKTAMLHALPHNIVTWTPQYYTIGVAVLLGSDPGIYCGVWDTKPYHNYNIAGSVLCKKRMSTSVHAILPNLSKRLTSYILKTIKHPKWPQLVTII